MEAVPAGTVAGQGITEEELRLAARNHAFRLEVGGAVERKLSLSLDDLRARDRVAEPITFECAGNGRALLEPRPISQPWLTEAVGTAEWAGAALRPLLDEAGPAPGAIEVLFTALDRGIDGGVPQWYERSLPIEDAELGLL